MGPGRDACVFKLQTGETTQETNVSLKGHNLILNHVMVQDAAFWCLLLLELESPIYYRIVSPSLDFIIQNMHEFCLFLTQLKNTPHACLFGKVSHIITPPLNSCCYSPTYSCIIYMCHSHLLFFAFPICHGVNFSSL